MRIQCEYYVSNVFDYLNDGRGVPNEMGQRFCCGRLSAAVYRSDPLPRGPQIASLDKMTRSSEFEEVDTNNRDHKYVCCNLPEEYIVDYQFHLVHLFFHP